MNIYNFFKFVKNCFFKMDYYFTIFKNLATYDFKDCGILAGFTKK